MPRNEQSCFDNLRGFVSFLSFSANGHSLVSSLIDAHKNAVVSRERSILTRIYKDNLEINKAFTTIIKASQNYTARGRPHNGSGTKHIVPGQFSGTYTNLHIIGDKHGYGVSSYIVNHKDYLKKISITIRKPIYFIHIYRNPFDVVARLKDFYKGTLDAIISKVSRRYMIVDRALSIIGERYKVLHLNFNNLLINTTKTLRNLLTFLHLEIYSGYMRSCKSIIDYSIPNERLRMGWKASHIDALSSLCYSIPYLKQFTVT